LAAAKEEPADSALPAELASTEVLVATKEEPTDSALPVERASA
jgi:hypothetical protein